MKSARQAHTSEGGGDLFHFTGKAPGFGSYPPCSPDCFIRRTRFITFPLAFQILEHLQSFRSAQDGAQQRGGALGVRGVAHLQPRGFADLIPQHLGLKRTGGETIRDALCLPDVPER